MSSQKFSNKLKQLRNKAVQEKAVTKEDWNESVQRATLKYEKGNKGRGFLFYSLVGAVIGLYAYVQYATMDPRCIVGTNLAVMELARPAVSCDLCKDLEEVPTVDGETFTKADFLKNYAYNGIPLLVKGAAKNWTALSTFSFKYLKMLYESTEGALEAVEQDCQFFPYKTDFQSMAEVFNMSEARSEFREGERQWYVGW